MFDIEIIAAVIVGLGSLALFGAIIVRETRKHRMDRHAMKVMDDRRNPCD